MPETIVEKMLEFINTYCAVENGDCVGVGVSGGKDSMVMLHALSSLRSMSDIDFDMKAFTVSLGFDGFNVEPIQTFCLSLGISHTVIDTKIGRIVFDVRKEGNPCSLCSNMRRGALNKAASESGCNKMALGHTLDDLIETYLMNIMYAGKPTAFAPVTYLSRTNIHLIRPLALSTAEEVFAYMKEHGIPTVSNPCPADGGDRRPEIRNVIESASLGNPHIRANIFGAIKRTAGTKW